MSLIELNLLSKAAKKFSLSVAVDSGLILAPAAALSFDAVAALLLVFEILLLSDGTVPAAPPALSEPLFLDPFAAVVDGMVTKWRILVNKSDDNKRVIFK